jgi:hypothetical protein
MFLRASTRKKDGKTHRYWSVVENRRLADGRVLQRHVLYLGEITDSQERAWRRSIEVLDEREGTARTLALLPEDRCEGLSEDAAVVRLCLSQLRLCRPRQWGAVWLAWRLWQQLGLDAFWGVRLSKSRKGTRWDQVLFVLVAYALRREKLRARRRREGRYLLRTNLTGSDPAELWRYYIQLVQVEEAFKNLKGDLAIRPIFHQQESRIEAHVFIAFLAYCLHATLTQQLRPHARGLTARSVLEKFAAVQMIDVRIPTTDGREIVLTRYTEPERDLKLLLDRLHIELPAQPPPRITTAQAETAVRM